MEDSVVVQSLDLFKWTNVNEILPTWSLPSLVTKEWEN